MNTVQTKEQDNGSDPINVSLPKKFRDAETDVDESTRPSDDDETSPSSDDHQAAKFPQMTSTTMKSK